ncbi:MAG: zinc ribbon domain-containing protein [Gaiellales bacterium]|nr:MAG: zinc ribbon domain-containing protein [Gaiellales bacterium]
MPIYEYCCRSCENRFEELVMSTAAENELTCPACGSGKLQRLFSGFACKPSEGSAGGAGRSCGPCSKSSCSSCG